MRYVSYAASFVILTLTACTHQAGSETTSQENAQLQKAAADYNAEQKNPDDRVVCRYEEVTGTLMKEKVCRTVAEMKKNEDDARRSLKESGSGGVPGK